MWVWVSTTWSIVSGLKAGLRQLSSRSSFSPWNIPASTSTRVRSVIRRCRDPVTVPAAPWNPRCSVMAISPSGRVAAAQAIPGLGACLLHLLALIGPQERHHLLVRLVEDRLHAREHVGVPLPEPGVRPAGDVFQHMVLRLVHGEPVGQPAHDEPLQAPPGETPLLQ